MNTENTTNIAWTLWNFRLLKVCPCKLPGVMKMFYIVIWLLATCMYTFVQMHWIICLGYIDFIMNLTSVFKNEAQAIGKLTSKCTTITQILVSFPLWAVFGVIVKCPSTLWAKLLKINTGGWNCTPMSANQKPSGKYVSGKCENSNTNQGDQNIDFWRQKENMIAI